MNITLRLSSGLVSSTALSLMTLLIELIQQRFAESLRKPVRTYRRSSTQELVVEEMEQEVTARYVDNSEAFSTKI